METAVPLLLLLLLISLPALIAHDKGRSFIGFFLYGLLLWPLALLHSLVMKDESIKKEKGVKPCPHCAENVKINALVCKHCGHDLVKEADTAPHPNSMIARHK